ncbi:protein kinase [Bowmanella sp. JS7-9]|uniref:Protein kinase n=1 Tax=Pseudobowmanella zhangzhouensis TaxID=1537679 RepID=A0ABW1XLX2_9ALTE|nr:protein kinase [Bowmanella sp. JS7-9]TBX23175.1 protein kinase [Bowmanella sp. JS7-9]
MSETSDFYSFEPHLKILMLEGILGLGKCIDLTGGMCGEIYIFDQGEFVTPRYVCAKVPKLLRQTASKDIAKRFVDEMEKQLNFYHHMFVHWAFDFKSVTGVPVALFRFWGSDLDKLIRVGESSFVEKLSLMIYMLEGLRHCQAKGLVAHQDLKPQNIFIREMKPHYPDLPELDIYKFPMIADFGLSNAFLDSGIYDGSRPYMAPEQWEKNELSQATDTFALGVIFYQLLTGGYHPVGIKLAEYWPNPVSGNSKKWTKVAPWKKWACEGAKVEEIGAGTQMNPEAISLIRQMLSSDPSDRPDIGSVSGILLDLLRQEHYESYRQVEFLLDYYNKQASHESFEAGWPYLAARWEWFKSEFGKHS